jgi:hypothetical protein
MVMIQSLPFVHACPVMSFYRIVFFVVNNFMGIA